MHARSILHRELFSSCPWMHAKRRSTLLAAVQATVLGSRLRLSDLGRGLSAAVGVKHNIKRIDRLLGNAKLHAETAQVYEMLARRCLSGVRTPLIIVDWSDLSADRHWQLLRASVALEGRSVTLYEEVHPLSRAAARSVHRRFLLRLGAMLPPGCRPIVITDAGFRSPWFRLIEQMGWYFVGRIRNRDMVRPLGGGVWVGCKLFYAKARKTTGSGLVSCKEQDSPMTRPLRIEFPGAVYHVTSRDDRREPIFVDDEDRSADCGSDRTKSLWKKYGTAQTTFRPTNRGLLSSDSTH